MAYICFALGHYDEALEYLLPLVSVKDPLVVNEFQQLAFMLQLICHFEKGDRLLLDSLIKSRQQVIANDGSESDVRRVVMSFIHSSLRKTKLEKEDWQKLEKKIRSIPSVNRKDIDFDIWAHAHANGISFKEPGLKSLD
jgi:hypothetical protein